jgi:FkbM family methyltransferase
MIRPTTVALVAAAGVQAVHIMEEQPAEFTGKHALAVSAYRILDSQEGGAELGASLLQISDSAPGPLPTCEEKACWKWDWTKPEEDPHTWQPHCSPESPSLMEAEHESKTLDKEGFKINYAGGQPSLGFYRDEYAAWEPETFAVFKKLATDKVVFDVGAWVGPTSLWLAHVGKKVFSLEPTQTAFAEMCANYKVNLDIKDKMVPLNCALDAEDRVAQMSNRGNSADALVQEDHADPFHQEKVDVQTRTVSSLMQEHPEIAETGFLKMDTEGYERVLVPALENFLREKKPNAYISLHPQYNAHSVVQGTVDKLKSIFPYLYEADMKTPFKTDRDNYGYGDHGGADVVCSWEPLL